ncbi:hypothetical protein [Pseudidiomarina sp.]|uniref:hypothetical protein n=1 Tax=Pseudidiomarina sp. TaxID=2081707 RepID=UPI00299D4F79|nr:hypothetical protein [Pseudidiomarina sp.]MDX1706311.1 hypothetical protein [Pseudidiomarina sp.]
MKQRWQRWQEKFLELPATRRRFWVILAAVMILYIGVWLVLLPLNESYQQFAQTERSQLTQQNALRQELAALEQRLQGDPKASLKRRLEQLNRRLEQVDQQLASETHYISASENKALLKALLTSAAGVKVKSAQALPAEQVYRDPADEDTGIFKHRLQLVVTGSYFDVQRYFSTLEDLPWSFYWQRLDYRVTEHPQAEVMLEIYTLSLERGYVAS